MAFSGLSSHAMFLAGNNAEDVAPRIALLAQDEVPLLDWLGDSDSFVAAKQTKHEFLEEELRPNYLTTSTAINSATVGATVADFGDLLTVGTVLEHEASTGVIQITSIVGPQSICFAQNWNGGGHIPNSIAPGTQLFVRGSYALDGQDHPGGDVSRKRRRRDNGVALFHLPVAISGTQLSVDAIGVDNELEHQVSARLREGLRDLEKEVIRGVPGSIGSGTVYRSFRGLRSSIGSINSTVTIASFQANPHLYIGDVWEAAFQNGASESETWGIVAGRTYFRAISNMNDTKVQDSNAKEEFKRVIRNYEGPFGNCTVFLSRWMPASSLLLIPRERVKVPPLQGRAFHVQDIAKTGDSEKKLIVGEYSLEDHHPQAMAQLKS
jgi:hypothetical protein